MILMVLNHVGWNGHGSVCRPEGSGDAASFEKKKQLDRSGSNDSNVGNFSTDRWLNNISNEISHEDRDIGPVYIDPLDLQILKEKVIRQGSSSPKTVSS